MYIDYFSYCSTNYILSNLQTKNVYWNRSECDWGLKMELYFYFVIISYFSKWVEINSRVRACLRCSESSLHWLGHSSNNKFWAFAKFLDAICEFGGLMGRQLWGVVRLGHSLHVAGLDHLVHEVNLQLHLHHLGVHF